VGYFCAEVVNLVTYDRLMIRNIQLKFKVNTLRDKELRVKSMK
jgi:hypothetical protein